MTRSPEQLAWYLTSVGAWFIPQGMLAVLVPWVVGVELGLGGELLGLAHTTFTLPALLFILIGGLVADRGDERRILVALHALISLPALLMGLLAWHGHLSYAALLVYLFILGTASAFMRPARDSLLTQVAGPDIQSTVTAATGVQFGVQIVGFALASTVGLLGSGLLFKVMAAVLMAGALAASRIRSSAMSDAAAEPGTGHAELRDGLRYVRRSAALFPVVLLNLAVGVFYMGAYFVVVPMLLLRQYGAGAGEIALANICFMSGTLFSTGLLLRAGGIQRRHARVLSVAVLANGVVITAIALGPALPAVLLLLFLWGAGTGVAMAMGRTIVQESAPAGYRARVLSIYALSFLGGAPLGSLLMGFLVEGIGAGGAGVTAAAGTASCVLLLSLGAGLGREAGLAASLSSPRRPGCPS